MKPLLIGSEALAFYHQGCRRSNLDIDIICPMDQLLPFVDSIRGDRRVAKVIPLQGGKKVAVQLEGGLIVEAILAWKDSVAERVYNLGIIEGTIEDDWIVPSLPFLYMLKLSHRFKKNSPHFLKTMRDIQFIQTLNGHQFPAKGTDYGDEFHAVFKAWEAEALNYKHPNLMQKKSEFFDASVKYLYDHDSIHEAVAVGNKPAYQIVKGDSHEVFMPRKQFESMPYTIQLRCTLEESYVLSLERAIIPFNITDPVLQKKAFDTALMKVCTSITSGYFREFSWENYDEVQAMYDRSYIEKFYRALDEGRIKPYGVNNEEATSR